MEKKSLTLNFIIFILAAAIGLGAGYAVFNKSCPLANECTAPSGTGFDDGWQAARDRLIKLGVISVPDDSIELKTLYGDVEKAGGDRLTIGIIPMEPLADPDLDKRNIIISANTRIYKLEEKDIDAYNREIEEYGRIVREKNLEPNASDYPAPPKRFNEVKIGPGEIKPGDKVKIDSLSELRQTKDITADKITVQIP